MRALLVILVLLGGCVDSTDPAPNVPPTPNQSIGETLTKIRSTVDVIGRVVALICEVEGAQAQVCVTLDDSFKMVSFALSEANKLFDTYLRTGLGVQLVHEAIDKVFAALEALNDNAAQMRGMVSDGSPSPSTRAFASCPGVGSWSVSEPAPAAPSTATQSHQPLPAPTP